MKNLDLRIGGKKKEKKKKKKRRGILKPGHKDIISLHYQLPQMPLNVLIEFAFVQ
jgi:hypothetical protein